MRTATVYILIIVWFIHLALMGAGAGYACLRIWPMRKDRFTKRLIFYLHEAMVEALLAIVLIFLARGVHFTWKFTLALFAGTLVRDVVRTPLILMLIRGLKEGT